MKAIGTLHLATCAGQCTTRYHPKEINRLRPQPIILAMHQMDFPEGEMIEMPLAERICRDGLYMWPKNG
jgi:hypothetical protein